MARPEFDDFGRLSGFRAALAAIEREAVPKARVLTNVDPRGFRRVGVLPGAFNPPTIAHVELARCAKQSFNLERIFFTLSAVIVDKERLEGLLFEDRLLLLERIADELDGAGVAIVNRGLYFEQAVAFRNLLGKDARLSFVCGMDKLVQIFDPRYYADRESALGTLLTEAQLLVAMRGDLGVSDLEAILRRPENEPYRDRVFPLTLPAGVRELSSTALRRNIVEGRDIESYVPGVVAEFIAATHAYRPGYDARVKLIENRSL
ncbi:MAG TPA: hypothetical protein VNL14_08990 [Candidatus Acidoferrales bacterium]|nr:hypothetical protein [Candidatus Acidoferrales bacterium]